MAWRVLHTKLNFKPKLILFSYYKMENLLKQIVNNTEPKRSFSIVVSDNKTRFKIWFKPFIQLDKKKEYEPALINTDIDRSKNCFTYSPNLNPHMVWHYYSWRQLSRWRYQWIHPTRNERNGHYDKGNDKDNTEISANTNTLKSEMILKNNYKVEFRQDKSINSLLGFHCKL